MLLGNTFYLILSIGLPIIVGALLGWLGWKKWGKYGAIGGILLSAVGFAAFQVTSAHLYVVVGKKELHDYRTFGTIDYRMTNGTIMTIPYEPRKVQIINSSDAVMTLEEIVYGGWAHRLEPGGWYIEPYDTASFALPQNRIDYFFDETIPEEIEEYGSGAKYKYWLHSAE